MQEKLTAFINIAYIQFDSIFCLKLLILFHKGNIVKNHISAITEWSPACLNSKMQYCGAGFECDILLIANCKFQNNSQSEESQVKVHVYTVIDNTWPCPYRIRAACCNCEPVRRRRLLWTVNSWLQFCWIPFTGCQPRKFWCLYAPVTSC